MVRSGDEDERAILRAVAQYPGLLWHYGVAISGPLEPLIGPSLIGRIAAVAVAVQEVGLGGQAELEAFHAIVEE